MWLSGDRVFRSYLRLNEVIGYVPNLVELWFYKKRKREKSISSPCEYVVGSLLQAMKRGRPCWHPSLGCPASRTVRNKFCCLSHPVLFSYDIPSRPKQICTPSLVLFVSSQSSRLPCSQALLSKACGTAWALPFGHHENGLQVSWFWVQTLLWKLYSFKFLIGV